MLPLTHGPSWPFTPWWAVSSAPSPRVPGFIDLLFYKGDAPPVKKIALTHMANNLIAVVLYAINIWLRTGGPTSTGTSMSAPVLLSIIGVALLCVSGWLGGQMVHVYGVGVEGRE